MSAVIGVPTFYLFTRLTDTCPQPYYMFAHLLTLTLILLLDIGTLESCQCLPRDVCREFTP